MSLHGQSRRRVPETGGEVRNFGREQGRQAVVKAEKVVELLKRALKLTAEDDPVQPAVEHLNAALYETEARLSVLENWYRRTYRLAKGCIADKDQVAMELLGSHDRQSREMRENKPATQVERRSSQRV